MNHLAKQKTKQNTFTLKKKVTFPYLHINAKHVNKSEKSTSVPQTVHKNQDRV